MPERTVPIVAIGASAGGLEALSQLLVNLPPGTGMAYLLVPHLDPSHATLLPEILAKKTAMPVREASDGLAVEPDHVYVIPPNTLMRIERGHLKLRPRHTTPGPSMPIDELLHSLAEEQGRNIGVVLSGTGSDGAQGMRALKHAGGITIVQDEASARFADMPRAAAALEAVDLVLPPAAIAQELARIAQHPYLAPERPLPVAEPASADDASLDRILRLLRDASGVDFTHYKRPTIKRRVARRLALHHLETLDDYVGFLETTPGEAMALYSDLLIRVTAFFREPKTYEALIETVIPALAEKRPAKAPLRIWVPGCASGEEVYSIAICLVEYLGGDTTSTPVQIFGTDLSETAIETARAGYYDESIEREVSAERLLRFFVKRDGHYRIDQSIRNLCIFARHDITRDPPFSRQDLVSCQNLLIYLDPLLQQRVIRLFHYALNPGGILVLGPAENLGPFSDLFSPVGTRGKVYAKKLLPGRLQRPASDVPARGQPPEAVTEPPTEAERIALLQREADRIALARYAPASVLCDEELNILQFRGDTGPFLAHAPGPPSLNLGRLARPGLDIEIVRAVRQARTDGSPVRRTGLRIDAADGPREVNLDVIPVRQVEGAGQWFLISFEAAPGAGASQPARPARALRASLRALLRPGAPAYDDGRTEEPQIARLTRELEGARDHIRTMREEHESSLEELKSAQEELLSSNEEFQSTNEELETSKEELQAANQELVTMNEELRHRNLELLRLNREMAEARETSNAIVDTLREPLLVLDEGLRIVQANDAFLETFRTSRDAAVGRRIYELGDGQWNLAELRRILEEILPESAVVEDFEMRQDLPGIGTRTMRMNARQLKWEGRSLILLAIEDSTERQAVLDALAGASRRKDEFLAMLAHELRNPLAAIRSGLEISRRPDADDATRAHAAEIMERQLQKEIRLIDDLLDVSRISRGTISLQSSPVDLKQSVIEAVEEMRHQLEAGHRDLSLSLPPNEVIVEGDAVRLEQIVANLLANSIKFTSRGGHISLTLECASDAAILRVRDDGVGIPAEQMSAIFDLFFQGDRSLDRAQGGLGLGLTLSRRLVELHGGTLEARSSGREQGSEFVVRLPLCGRVPAAGAAREQKAWKIPPRRRILVVDDNADAAESLSVLLKLDHHEVHTVPDGASAIAALREFRPEVVLLDIGLPDMDGYEVARRFRALPEGREAVLIAVTGYGRAADRRRATEAGFDHHLLKPVDLAVLAEILGRAD